MKKLLALFLFPMLALGQATTGFHRVAQVIARAPLNSVTAQVVPQATVVLTNTSDGTAASVYSDPGLSVGIPNSTLTTDLSGNYNYYFALNTCITETISSPNLGIIAIPNICSNGGGGGSTGCATFTSTAATIVCPSGVTINTSGSPGAALTVDTGTDVVMLATTDVTLQAGTDMILEANSGPFLVSATAHSGDTDGISISEDSGSVSVPVEIQNTSPGNISIDSAGGISIEDASSVGWNINSSAGNGGLSAHAIALNTSSASLLTGNGSEICTIANAVCPAGSFSSLTSGTNTTAAMLVGTGASLGPTGSGIILATSLNGGALGSLPNQSAANTTVFVASPTTSGHVFVPTWSPFGSAIALASTDLGSYLGTNVTAASPIVATPSTLGVQFSCPTCGSSSGGTAVTVNGGGALASLNINAISPVADASYLALLPKISGASMIIEAPYATSSAFGVLEGDGSTTTITAGVIKCTTATSSQIGCVKPDNSTVTISGGVISAFGGNFSSLLGGTNTTAAMVVGTGASLGVSGSGTIVATSAPYSGLTGSVPTWNQSTTGNAATATALATAPTLCSTGNAPTGVLASGNATGCAAIGGSPLWSSLSNPSANLNLTMGSDTSTFTFGSATGSADLFKFQDSASNTGTGILFHITTAAGSTEIPFQADANGVGCKITANGLTCFGAAHILTLGSNSGGLPSPVASSASLSTDSSGNLFSSIAGGTFYPSTQTIASGQVAVPTTALAGNTCDASATTATATGAATTDAGEFFYASDPTGVTGYGAGTNGGITIRPWATLNTFNFKRCNESSGSITPGALSINWRIAR